MLIYNHKEGLNEIQRNGQILKADGWYEVSQRGSHHQYKHPTKPGKVTVPEHGGKDINLTVAEKILKQAGL